MRIEGIEEHLYSVREEEAIKADLSTYLKRHEQKEVLRFLVAGSVDDGKSTLIGRLLYDSKLIYQDHLNAIYRDSRTYNTTDREIDLSLLTDGLKAEREQGITIDIAYRYFSTEKRSFMICDAPGHEQYTRNMATGASHCDLVLILIDVTQGIKDQTRRHSLIATLMGARQVVVLVNKMDIIGFQEDIFRSICSEYNDFSDQLDIQSLYFIPVSALDGDNIVEKSDNMFWYQGEPLLKYLEEVPLVNDRNLTDFRFPVQTVIRPDSKFRGYAGSIVSGVIHKGDLIRVFPSGQQTCIQSIETSQGKLNEAFAPMPVVLTTSSEVDISRGCILAKVDNLPYKSNSFEAMLVWMDNEKKLHAGNQYLLKCSSQQISAVINKICYKYDLNQLTKKDTESLSLNDIGKVEITTSQPLIFDSFLKNKKTGSFILIDRMSNQTSSGGMIIESNISQAIDNQKLETVTPITIWLTGLSGAGKSTIAEALHQYLKERNIGSYILDGDELRKGLNNNLSFSPEDRKENVRRTAEVAKLLNNAGLISIVALISPYASDRKLAKDIIGKEFIEVFVNTNIETCRKRDPKGLYKKADIGEIREFTGVDAPYEKPENPDVIIDTTQINVKTAVGIIINYIYVFCKND